MGTFTVEEELEIPSGVTLDAKLMSLKGKTIEWDKDGQHHTKDLLKWAFKVTSGEFADEWIFGETEAKLSTSTKNRFRMWAEALTGLEITKGMSLDTEDLIGLTAAVTTTHRNAKDGRVFLEIATVTPVNDTPF